jgi:NitT/TauT family transport system permease protein
LSWIRQVTAEGKATATAPDELASEAIAGAPLEPKSDGPPGRPEAAPRESYQKRIVSLMLANGVPLLVLLFWWWIARRSPAFIIPAPFDVLRTTGRLLYGDMAIHTYTSFVRIIIAVLLAMGLGGSFVFMVRLLPVTQKLVGDRLVPFLDSVPALGWAILGVIWFGLGHTAVVFVVTAVLLPFALVNLWEGMRAIDPDLREMGLSFTRQRLRILSMIEIPLLMPYIFAALRLSFSVGWKVALIAEFFGSEAGLGLVMNRGRQLYDTSTVFATIVTVLVIVTVVERFVFEPLGKWFAKRTGTDERR